MNKAFLTIALAAIGLQSAAYGADTLRVSKFRVPDPIKIQTPYIIDSLDNNSKAFSPDAFLETPADLSGVMKAELKKGIPTVSANSIQMIGFTLQSSSFAKGKLSIEGIPSKKIYFDSVESTDGTFKFEPGTHSVIIKYICSDNSREMPAVSVITEKGGPVNIREDNGRLYDLNTNSYGASCGGVALSPSGKYMSVRHSLKNQDGKSTSYTDIMQTSDSKVIGRIDGSISWMPSSDMYYVTRNTTTGKCLVAIDPETFQEKVLCANLPEGSYTISPTEDYLIYSLYKEGPAEGEVHQVLNPEDRQPGWRTRGYLAKYDLSTGIMQPLTFGYHNTWLDCISNDGKYIMFSTTSLRITQRPTTLYSIYRMNVETLEVTPVVENDGFVGGGAVFSPDGSEAVVMGSPEAFGSIGADVKPGQTPNEYDYQLFIVNFASGKVTPITKKFNPSIETFVWSKADGKIYVKVDDKDLVDIYRIDPKSAKAERLPISPEYILSFDLAQTSAEMIYYGETLESTHKVYTMDLKTKKETLVYDFNPDRLSSVDLGKGNGYEFTSSRGDKITGFYVLPPDFDSTKKYPMLVYYYGGCSPSSRYCIGSYSPQMYAAQGYVFFVVNPSGAAGFGQEWAARHVNTAGDGIAEDIIEATKSFCKDHPFVDASKVGCFGASYGGFMTQNLLTKTDIFSAAISHAGISDHSSYWGEGYWGYSYSEVSMANSYPWTRKDLFVDRSPLYNADKIHTPLLFLHGSADTNVPIGESIQMFTALQILGADTAFVVLDGEDHGVLDYAKRRQWIRIQSAWFQKYLKGDSSWWDELYPEKNL